MPVTLPYRVHIRTHQHARDLVDFRVWADAQSIDLTEGVDDFNCALFVGGGVCSQMTNAAATVDCGAHQINTTQ